MGLRLHVFLLGLLLLLLLLRQGKSARARPAGGLCRWALGLGTGTCPLREHKMHSAGPGGRECSGQVPEAAGPGEGLGRVRRHRQQLRAGELKLPAQGVMGIWVPVLPAVWPRQMLPPWTWIFFSFLTWTCPC